MDAMKDTRGTFKCSRCGARVQVGHGCLEHVGPRRAFMTVEGGLGLEDLMGFIMESVEPPDPGDAGDA